MRYTSIATANSRCNILSDKAKELVCNPHLTIDPTLRQCCANCAEFGSCFEPQAYLKWKDESLRFMQDVPGIGQDLFYLFLIGVVYKILLIIIEYGVLKVVLGMIFKSDKDSFQLTTDDEDVINEKRRVDALVRQGELEKYHR